MNFHTRKRVICAAAAMLITGLTQTVFVAAEPQNLDKRGSTVPRTKADAATIDRGRYIVRTSGCNDCHTPNYPAMAGKVDEAQWLVGDSLGWQGPWGTTYPANLRLLMQSMTAEQWLNIARSPARPPMPWFSLRDMTDADLLAIYHYVRSLGPAGQPAPAYLPPSVEAKTPVVKFPQH